MNGLTAVKLGTVIAKIESDFNRAIPLEELARLANLSQFHFARVFRKQVGTSPHAYIVGKRMECARELLASSQRPIKEISESVGYSTQAHFTAAFRQHCGTTPAAFRKLVGRQAPIIEGALPS